MGHSSPQFIFCLFNQYSRQHENRSKLSVTEYKLQISGVGFESPHSAYYLRHSHCTKYFNN